MNLIVMLTYNDYTVKNALEVFEACKDTPVSFWGAKEQGLSHGELKALFSAIKAAGKHSVLEVVAYTEEESLAGAKAAADCGCEILLGTKYFHSVAELCRTHGMKYLPFVGEVSGRPSILKGEAQQMLAESEELRQKGVYGVDLLGYRYQGDCNKLCRQVVEENTLPVCLAGSINTMERLDQVLAIRPAYYTVGSAFFENSFGDQISEQIEFVCKYMGEGDSRC